MIKGTKNYPQEEIDRRTKLLEDAREIRKQETEKHDKILLEHIYKYPGKTSSQIESDFSDKPDLSKIFVRSYLINALKRLEKKKLYVHTEEKQGKLIKRYFYRHEAREPGTIIITEKELEGIINCGIDDWISKASVFALEANKIAITTNDNLDISKKAKFGERPNIVHEKNQIKIILPQNISDFYNLNLGNFYFKWEIKPNTIELIKNDISETIDVSSKPITNIIILEDDTDFREILTEKLQEEGYNVVACKSDEDVVSEINRGNNFDYFVADDSVGGQKIARAVYFELRKYYPKIRAGLISGSSRTETEEQGLLDVGFTCIFQKGKHKKEHHGLSEIGDELSQHLRDLNERE